MTVAQMRAWIKTRYSFINGKGGNKVHIDSAPEPQVIAAYYSMLFREQKAKMTPKPALVKDKNKQYQFVF